MTGTAVGLVRGTVVRRYIVEVSSLCRFALVTLVFFCYITICLPAYVAVHQLIFHATITITPKTAALVYLVVAVEVAGHTRTASFFYAIFIGVIALAADGAYCRLALVTAMYLRFWIITYAVPACCFTSSPAVV